jgi:ankyrin repeat protein
VDEYELMKKIIQQAPPEQKEFWALDIGAGNFEWSAGLANYLEKQSDFPKDIRVHILGVRGESFGEPREVSTGRCTVYNLGAFKVEKIFDAFRKRGFELENKLDLAVTHWCFRHLVDPTGTFIQIFNLLVPGRGFFLLDGFYFLDEKTALENWDGNQAMTQLLVDTKVPFLTRFYNSSRSLNQFILQRPNADTCRLPMSYIGYEYVSDLWQVGFHNVVTRFKREPKEGDLTEVNLSRNYWNLYGDKKMYKWLKENDVLERPQEAHWRSIPQETLPLHQMLYDKFYITRSDIQEYLDAGGDIDETDCKGRTALHIAIKEQWYHSFKNLLSLGADFEFVDNQGRTPLHRAAITKTSCCLRKLIKLGASINELDVKWRTPLHIAIKNDDYIAFEALLQAGADVSRFDWNGRTPLHQAVLSKRKNLYLWILIAEGASPNANGNGGETPLDCAIRAKNLNAIEVLIEAGAEISDKNIKDLKDPAFDRIHQRNVVPINPLVK